MPMLVKARTSFLAPRRHACLVQAIAASRLLTRRGAPWVIGVGLRGHGASLEAHAWAMVISSAEVPNGFVSSRILPSVRGPGMTCAE